MLVLHTKVCKRALTGLISLLNCLSISGIFWFVSDHSIILCQLPFQPADLVWKTRPTFAKRKVVGNDRGDIGTITSFCKYECDLFCFQWMEVCIHAGPAYQETKYEFLRMVLEQDYPTLLKCLSIFSSNCITQGSTL